MNEYTAYYTNFHKNAPDAEAARNLVKIKKLRRRTTYLLSNTHDGRLQLHAHITHSNPSNQPVVGRWKLVGVWEAYSQATYFILQNGIAQAVEDKTHEEANRRGLARLTGYKHLRHKTSPDREEGSGKPTGKKASKSSAKNYTAKEDNSANAPEQAGESTAAEDRAESEEDAAPSAKASFAQRAAKHIKMMGARIEAEYQSTRRLTTSAGEDKELRQAYNDLMAAAKSLQARISSAAQTAQ